MNRRVQRGVAFAAALGLLLAATTPREGAAQGAAVATIGAGLAQASGAVDDIATKAGNEANYVVFSAAAELRVLIENLRLSARDVLEEGFSELNNSQQVTFDNVQKGIASLQRAINEPMEQGRQTVEQIHQMANDIAILGAHEVTVLRAMPAVVAPSAREVVPFTVRGLSLDKGNPRLFFGNIEARRMELIKQQAIFSVPASAFQHAAVGAQLQSGRLVLTVKECEWLVFCKDVPHEFRIAVMTLPTQVARVTVTYNRKGDQRVYREPAFAKSFGYSTGDLTHTKCTTEPQAPHAPGFFIDTESLSAHRTHGRASNSFEVLSVSPGGFAVRMCAQAQIRRHFRKRSGEISVLAKWREYKMENVVSPFEALNSEQLNWGTNFARTLPEDAYAISVQMEYFDKSSKTYIGNGTDKYLDVNWNAGTKQLVVTPKAPTTIADFG